MHTPRAIDSVVKAVGRTPLVRLRAFESPAGPALYAKCEYLNPGGSIFDRAASAQIAEAVQGGHLSEGRGLVAAGGTDAVVSLAMVASALGHALTLVVPRSMLPERKRVLVDYGARLVAVDDAQGLSGAFERVMMMAKETGALAVCLADGRACIDAYGNIGREIEEALGKAPSVVVCGLDRGAIPRGIAQGLTNARLVLVQPGTEDHLMLGLGREESAKLPDRAFVEAVDDVSDAEAWSVAERTAKETGLLVGLASGAVLSSLIRRAQKFGPDDALVAVLPDGGERRFMLAPFFS